MTIKRLQTGDVEVRVSIFRDGQELKNDQGSADIGDYISSIEIFESITSATLEAKFTVADSGGFLGAMTGSELFKIRVLGTILDRTYYFRAYEIESRSRYNTADVFIVNAVSDDYLKNEVVNIFGNSQVIFDNETEASSIVERILKDNRFLQTNKRLFLEETTNKQQFVATNWRPFDCIYWIAQRSMRKSQKGNSLQNGFVFFENSLGYNFKSIDKIIDDVENQSETEPTNFTTGNPKLYTYVYTPKKTDDQANDHLKIETVVFPGEKNFLTGLRHGAWSGFSIGFDPVTITSSKMGLSTDMSVDAYRYDVTELWDRMSHLNRKKTKNPVSQMDQGIQDMIGYPKRVRYTMLPNQAFDENYKTPNSKSYEELVELQAYQWMRFETFKNIQLQIKIPGNLDLYVGTGINIVLPATYKKNSKTEKDRKYSGRYVIASLSHNIVGTKMTTEALLVKDSTI